MTDVDRFLADRQPSWRRLESLLDRMEAVAAHEIRREEVHELVGLYRQACSDLNRARSLTANPSVLSHLDRMTGRAYRFIYRAAPRRRLLGGWRDFLAATAPSTLRRHSRHVLAAASSMAAGAVLGAVVVAISPAAAELLVPEMFFTASPRERVERIESGEERIRTGEQALFFGASLYVHNIRVSFLAFSLAALTLVGAHVVLFHNGVILGAVAASYHVDGVQAFFWGWVGPHGALELPAIVIAAAAGLCLGEGLLLPGDLTRSASLRLALPPACAMLGTACLLLVVAGLIEGSLSQMSSKTVPTELKIAVAATLFSGLVAWIAVAGRGREAGAPRAA